MSRPSAAPDAPIRRRPAAAVRSGPRAADRTSQGRTMSGSNPPPSVPAGPVRPGPEARTALRPAAAAEIRGGFWHARRETNARVGIPQGPGLLESAGNLHDLRLAAGSAEG